jgi:hypothetical protein
MWTNPSQPIWLNKQAIYDIFSESSPPATVKSLMESFLFPQIEKDLLRERGLFA